MIQSAFFKKISVRLYSSRLAVPLLVAALLGIATGFVTVGFIRGIEFSTELFFGRGEQALGFMGRYWIILIPALGGLVVGLLVTFLAPEAKGHGVPEVMVAIALRGGKIRPIVVLVKAIASAIAIGSGSSVGREGPIVQVGSALGSSTGQALKLNTSRIRNLIACGAAAGISAVFNAPIAGVMFSLEVILRDFGARALSTVVVSAVSASIISRIYLGDSPAFVAPVYSLWHPFEIFLYLGLGILSAFTALLYIFVLDRSETLFDGWKFPEWLKPAVGGLLIGLIGFFFPQIFGTGLQTIEAALHGNLALNVLFLLIFLKIFATSISLGSGSSGGVFAPALFIGAVLGDTVGNLFYQRFPFPVAPPGAYALVGMASVFAGAAHAPVTAILIVFEMTGDYRMILPIMMAVVVSTSLAQLLKRESIYTVKLKKRGVDIESLEEAKYLGAIQVRDAMDKDFMTVPKDMPVKKLVELMGEKGNKHKTFFVVDDAGSLHGVIQPEKIEEILFEKDMSLIVADDVATPCGEACVPDDSLSESAQLMMTRHLKQMPVVHHLDPSKVVGVLNAEDVFRAYTQVSAKRSMLLDRLEQQEATASGTVQIHFVIASRSPLVGMAIRNLDLPDGVVLTSIRRKKAILIPEGFTELQAKDKIWAVVVPQSEELFRAWMKKHGL